MRHPWSEDSPPANGGETTIRQMALLFRMVQVQRPDFMWIDDKNMRKKLNNVFKVLALMLPRSLTHTHPSLTLATHRTASTAEAASRASTHSHADTPQQRHGYP